MLGKFLIILLAFCPALGFTQPSDLDCLTVNVFFESRGESLAGKRAVADVTINRTKHPAFTGQDTICKVVFAKGQFSWTTQPKKRTQNLLNGDLKGFRDNDVLMYHLSRKVAMEALDNKPESKLPASVVSFHNNSVNPNWSATMRKYGTIGSHVFYSFKRKG